MNNLDSLRSQIEAKFGRKVANTSDCEALAAVITEETRQHISTTTLKRLFIFKNENQPKFRDQTIEVLKKYIGQ
ncbi:MAG: hypothetical protein NC453_12265 [Muribaculum sp.]|nr:hypothetical protein [Muribaculum sp.]